MTDDGVTCAVASPGATGVRVSAAAAAYVCVVPKTLVIVTSIVFDRPDSGSILRNESTDGLSDAVTVVAAARFTIPPPRFCGFDVPSAAGRAADVTSALFTMAGVQSGCSCSSSAAEPATWGVAMLVPENSANFPPRIDENTFTPGAVTSGLMSSRFAGPRLEKPARMLPFVVTISLSTLPSALAVVAAAAAARIAPRSEIASMTAGIVGWSAVPSLPIAIGSPATLFTTSTPAAPAFCALRIFVENVHVPRSITTIWPA